MCTILKIFSIAEILSWVCRGEYPRIAKDGADRSSRMRDRRTSQLRRDGGVQYRRRMVSDSESYARIASQRARYSDGVYETQYGFRQFEESRASI